jgi:hypothetical protein
MTHAPVDSRPIKPTSCPVHAETRWPHWLWTGLSTDLHERATARRTSQETHILQTDLALALLARLDVLGPVEDDAVLLGRALVVPPGVVQPALCARMKSLWLEGAIAATHELVVSEPDDLVILHDLGSVLEHVAKGLQGG